MKKILLAFLILNILYLILSVSSVLAKCLNASGAPGCSGGCSCLYDFFSSQSLQPCDPNSADSNFCFCTPSDPSQYGCGISTPPVPTLPPGASPYLPSSLPISCNSANSGDKDSRPVPCDSCNQTSLLTPACASNFSLIDSVNYQRSDAGAMCNDQHWLQKEWSGTVTIDPNNTKVPFVGKKSAENEQKYLADYFEGTKYYKPQLDLKLCEPCLNLPKSNPPELEEQCQKCQKELRDIILTAGVWPKLAPLDLQDDYKRQMIDRAQKRKIHDYTVSYSGQTTTLSQFVGHLKPKQSDYPTVDAWQQNLQNWQNADGGKWSTLWIAIPMFSKEDTPGEINPELGRRPADTFKKQVQIEQVPHLARLYEATKAIQSLLVPFSSSSPTPTPAPVGQNKNIYALTQAEINNVYETKSKVLGEQTPDFPYGCKYYYSTNPNDPTDCSCMGNRKPDGEPQCRGEHGGCCPLHGWWGICGYSDCKPEIRCPGGPPSNGCPMVWLLNPTPEPAQSPALVCGLGPAKAIPNCSQQEALTDSNPNDTICCQEMKMSLTGVDTFANIQYSLYLECLKNPPNGDPNKCEETLQYPVSRGIAVNLQHPYLKEIWQQTARITSGLFNIFRAQTTESFKETPAKSTINYRFEDPKNPAAHAETSPGDFYFPYLGGVQKAKEFVINLLNPAN